MIKKVHQILISYDNIISNEVENRINHVKEVYHDFEYTLWTDEKIKSFLIQYFNQEVLDAYNTLVPFAFKADLARFCILYIYGGVYLDLGTHVKRPFVFEKLTFPLNIYHNNVIDVGGICCPHVKHNFLLDIINNILYNVKHKIYDNHELNVSGPGLLKNIYTKDKQKYDLNFIHVGLYENDERHAGEYFDYKLSSESGSIGCLNINGNNYNDIWHQKNVYGEMF